MTRLLLVAMLAISVLGETPRSCSICFQPTEAYPILRRPIVQTSVTAKICRRCHTVDLTWQPSATPQVTSYAVYRNGVRVAQGAALSMTDDTVVSGKQYQYFVTALVSTSESDPSNTVQVVIP